MQQKITLKEIAQMAGTSIGTVDRALHDRGRINPETKEKILKIVDQLGYKPNVMASSLSKKTKLHIGIIMSGKPEEFCNHLIHGLKDAIDEISVYGVTTEFILTDTLSPQDQMAAIHKLDEDKFDAFLVNAGSRVVGEWIDTVMGRGKIVVTFNSDVETCSRLCYVGEDPYRAGLLMGNQITEVVPELKRIALFLGFRDNYSHVERCRGVKEAVRSVYPKIEFVEFEYQDEAGTAREKAGQLLESKQDVQAFFAASGTGVWGIGQAVSELRKDMRPKVFGYDVSSQLAELMDLNLCQATAFQDPYWQGFYSMKLLSEHLLLKQKITRDKYIIRTKLVLKNNVRDYLMDRHQYDGFLL
ncbi:MULTISPECIES: substrate-binding domain-containing protein [Clostridia]|uniref:substrate-binding domain-containing protein n=1 Tax=Clostridia TaxID=186801 RepID=UPI00067EA485|nr:MULTISPECIES: substrate-binding domain-containing protein [Clostridia]